MRCKILLALFSGAGLLFVGPGVLANDDNDNDEHAAPAMQLMIDEKTGHKIEHEDDSGQSHTISSNGVVDMGGNSNISAMIPAVSQPPRTNSDGSRSAQIGLEHFEYLVLTKGENGETKFTHVPADQFDADKLPAASAEEEK